MDTILGAGRGCCGRSPSEFSSFASSPEPRPAPTRLSEVIDEVSAPYRAGLAGNVALDIEAPARCRVLSLDRTCSAAR